MVEFVRIGRETDNDVPIRDSHISGYHAVVYRTASGYQIFDLRSTNGVFVNGKQVWHANLQPGDQIALGKNIMFDIDDLGEWFKKQKSKEISIERVDYLRIGKASDNEIQLDDSHVSRYHAIICFLGAGKGFHIYDLNSLNHTYVEGKCIEHQALQVVDRATLGQNLELPWDRIIQLFSQRAEQQMAQAKSPHETSNHAVRTTWIKEQLENVQRNVKIDIERENEQTERKIREKVIRFAIAGVGFIAILGVLYKLFFHEGPIEQNVLPYRDSVVMVIHKQLAFDKPVLDKGSQEHIYTQIDGTRIKVFSSVSEEGKSYGSGFLYAYRGELFVITNKHVVQPSVYNSSLADVERSGQLTVRLQGQSREYPVDVVDVHPSQDVAVLKFREPIQNYTSVEIDPDWGNVDDGDKVVCMSYPLAMAGQVDGQVKADLIPGSITNKFPQRIKYNLVSAPGASGGPVFNGDGRVIAINQGGSVDKKGTHIQGINWGLPVIFAQEIFQQAGQ
jgi:pSer/pThr/pTyr-binding forkhead associated (FHA) protein